MASIHPRVGKTKTTYRVHFQLFLDNQPWVRTKSFATERDANAFLPSASVIESKCKMNLSPPQEVALWVEQNYITMEEAVKAFPFYAASLEAENKGRIPIDWGEIEEEFSDVKIDLAGDKDDSGENHQHKMRQFRRVKRWLQEEHSTLQFTRRDVEAYLRSMRQKGLKAQTRKHWLITFNLIADIAVRLGMMNENPAKSVTDEKDKITVSVPSRPKYIKRALLPKNIAQAMLDWRPNTNEDGAVDEEFHYERKAPRQPHVLSSVRIESLKTLPETLHRSDVMDALNVSYASIKRYVSEGILPKPSTDPIARKRWSMKRQDLIDHVARIHEEQLAKTRTVRLRPEQTTMRGCFPLAFRLGLWAGLRNSEAVWLPWDHVHIEERRLFIGQVISPLGVAWSPKSDIDNEEAGTKERWLGMTPSLCSFFATEKKRQEAAGLKTFFLFPSGRVNGPIQHGKPLGARVLNDAFQKHLQWAGFPKQEKLTYYSLRHTFCTELLRKGVAIEDVRDRMGHTDIRTTQTYLHAESADAHVEDVLETFASDGDPQQTL